jgi:prophage regulatory protein
MTDIFLRIKQVLQITGLTRSTLFRQINKGHFPVPIKIGSRASAWSKAQIMQWMDDRKSGVPLGKRAKQSK